MKKNRSRCYQENLVKLAIEVLEKKVDPKFRRKRGLWRLHIHKQVNNNYHKIFMRIIEYLKELKGDYKNDLGDLLCDYYISVYHRFKKFKRVPSLSNFSPSSSNKICFEEFIYNYTNENDEEYWVREIPEPPEVIHVPIIPEDNDFIPLFVEV